MQLHLGPPMTFAPVSPGRLPRASAATAAQSTSCGTDFRRAARPRLAAYDFVPHVTDRARTAAPERIETFVARPRRLRRRRSHRSPAMSSATTHPDRDAGTPVADAAFEQPLVVGRGRFAHRDLGQSRSPMLEVASVLRGHRPSPRAPRRSSSSPAASERGRRRARGQFADGGSTFDEVVGDRELEQQLLRAATRSADGRA